MATILEKEYVYDWSVNAEIEIAENEDRSHSRKLLEIVIDPVHGLLIKKFREKYRDSGIYEMTNVNRDFRDNTPYRKK